MADRNITCRQFGNALIARSEHLDEDILHDILPWEPWIGDVATGQFDAYDGTEHTFDRLTMVYPDLTGAWQDLPNASCVGQPCDMERKEVGYGYVRDSYKIQRRGYKSALFCWDQMMTYDRAIEQMAEYVAGLREVSKLVVGDRMRLEAMRISTKYVADAAMTPLTMTWNATMTQVTVNALPTSCLTGEMLMRQYQPMCNKGYFGKNPTNSTMLIVCKTDLDSLYRINAKVSNTNNRWRYTEFDQGSTEYFKYGWSGQIGNFAVKAELFPPRFNLRSDIGPLVLERVFPFRNISGTAGIVREDNPDYLTARYQWSQVVWKSEAMRVLGFDPAPVNPDMPFSMRDLAGKWVFAMDNLGADENGCIIENPLRNKGRFYADFYLGTKAERPEWAVGILHLREPICITIDEPCTDDPGYPEQSFNSANTPCDQDLLFTPTLSGQGVYSIAANTIKCNGIPIVHSAVSGASIAALVISLNTNVSILGTWVAGAGDTDRPEEGTLAQIELEGAVCPDVTITWEA